MAEKEITDRWAAQNYFGEEVAPPSLKREARVRVNPTEATRVGAQTTIWQLAARNRREGYSPVASPSTLSAKKNLGL